MILTIGGACVPAHGVAEFTFWPMAEIEKDIFIPLVPDTILYPYQLKPGLIVRPIKPEALYSL